MRTLDTVIWALTHEDEIKRKRKEHLALVDEFDVNDLHIRVDSCYAADFNIFETYVEVGTHMNNAIAETYLNEEEMKIGHVKWVERMKNDQTLPLDVHREDWLVEDD
jgi:hypothetical protein